MEQMLNHVDSPYIRCIGFLYLRYACDPKDIWDWFMPYLYDTEEIKVAEGNYSSNAMMRNHGSGRNGHNNTGTVGDFVRGLLEELDYYGTRLPRFPIGIEKDIKVKLLQEEQIEQRAVGHERDGKRMEYFQKVGSKVRAMYGDEENAVTWYDAVVDRVIWRDDETGEQYSRPKFVVTFPEYGNTETVSLGEMDVPGSVNNVPLLNKNDSHYRRNDRGINERNYDRDYRNNQRFRDNHRQYPGQARRQYDDSYGRMNERGDMRRRDRSRSRSRDRNATEVHSSTAKDSEKTKTAEEIAAIEEKKRKLLQKYG